MQVAIVGLARSGKTTVFNTLTRGEAETGGFGGLTVNVGVVKVPDERLTKLTELFRPKREVPADVTYVDLPAPPVSVDGREPADQWEVVRFSLPADLAKYVVEKGSITVDGVSLTVMEVTDDTFSVGLIPATSKHTVLGSKGIGEPVNLEVDVIAKYVEKMLGSRNV